MHFKSHVTLNNLEHNSSQGKLGLTRRKIRITQFTIKPSHSLGMLSSLCCGLGSLLGSLGKPRLQLDTNQCYPLSEEEHDDSGEV